MCIDTTYDNYVYLCKKLETMLDTEFTKKLMFAVLLIGVVSIPIILLSPLHNISTIMSIALILMGAPLYISIKHDEYLDKKRNKLENTSNNTK